MADRIYIVEQEGGDDSLVRGVSPGRALAHVIKDQFKARIATAEDVARILTSGGTIQQADAEEPAPNADTPDTPEGDPVGEEVKPAPTLKPPPAKPTPKPAPKPLPKKV